MTKRKEKIEQVLKTISELSHEEYLEVLELITQLMKTRGQASAKQCSLADLQGVGTEVWQKVDIEEYLDEQRQSWK